MITTVWVGVFVVCLFNLRFGWVLSGLVVPGYIVPLLIAKPVSAMVVLGEASLTYGLFWLMSEKLSGPTRWSSFFGRDRFMGLILVSVAVRLLLDGWLLPILAGYLDQRYGIALDWRHNLHSFGLIVVALLANQLWKPGYLRGITQVLVMIGATFLIVRYGLMELTNFRIGAVVYLYEDFATSILASPKAYIILITTCFIASRMNLRYGWDFSGILIPALLALQWYQPAKILTSFVEALIIYFIASVLLSSRLFASSTIEGGRKLLLFFNISFAYKLALGHALAFAGVEQRITDYYGFGYLLPTLIALKAHDKDILARVTRATAQISLMGALAGSLAGFVLNLFLPVRSGTAAASVAPSTARETDALLVARAVGGTIIAAANDEAVIVAPGQAGDFRTALRLLNDGRSLAEARALLAASGFSVQSLAGGGLAIVPRQQAGFLILFDPRASRSAAIAVPDPAAMSGLALAGFRLFEQQKARWMIVGGARPGSAVDIGLPPARLFSDALDIPMLEIRAASGPPQLELAGAAGSQIDLGALRQTLPGLQISFGRTSAPASTFLLPPAATRAVLASTIGSSPALGSTRFTRAEMTFIHSEVILPLSAGSPAAVAQAAAAGAAIGVEVADVSRPGEGPIFALRRAGQADQLYLFRPGATGPLLQTASSEKLVPQAARLFRDMNAAALMIVPDPRWLDGEEAQLLPLLTQSLLARSPEGQLILQVRRPPRSQAAPDPMLAVDRIEPAGGMSDRLIATLVRSGISARPVVHGPADAGLEVSPSTPVRFATQAHDGRAAILWMEPRR